jgi:hypothetical protein
LSLELPPTPLFQDEDGGNVIPQVLLSTVLKKFDGVTATVRPTVCRVKLRRKCCCCYF